MKTIILLGKKIFRAELVKGSFYIMVASTAGGFMAMLFNLFLTRKISPAEFGIYNSLVSFFTLITVFSQSIMTVIAQYATPLLARKEIGKAAYLYGVSIKYILIICGIMFLIIIGSSGILGSFLHISGSSYFLLVAALVSLTYFGIINNAFLQGLLKFGFMAWTGLVGSVSRLLFGIIVVSLGFHILGALGSLLFAALVPLCIGFYPLRFLIFSKKTHVMFSKKDVFYYALSVSIITFSLLSFTSTDIILVKHFFNPIDAGLYSEMSLVGKAIFYFSAPISTVLFPLIIKRYHQGDDFLKTFYSALLLVFFPSTAITLFYFLFPHFTLSLFLGGKFGLSPFIGYYALFISVFSLLNVTVTFLLSLKKISIMFPMACGALLQVLCISFFHANFFQVIFSSLIITSILLAGILLYYGRYYGPEEIRKKPSLVINNTSV